MGFNENSAVSEAVQSRSPLAGPPVPDASIETPPSSDVRRRRWTRWLRRGAIIVLLLWLAADFIVGDYVRTLQSLRHIPGTHAFVMDYYADYHLGKIRRRGMDVSNIEDSYITTLLPEFVLPIARRLKRVYLTDEVRVIGESHEHCSTVALRSKNGDVFFGRNLDYGNDACLIVRVHDAKGIASIAVIDLAYLNLNRPDLDETSLIRRLPLLCAPYYVMDGMNRYGVAVSDMAVRPAEPPVDPEHPAIVLATLERLILDYAKDADEAVELVRAFNVHFVVTPEHLMVADATGRFRIVEFIDGKIRVTSTTRPWQVCTNEIAWNKTEAERDASCRRYRIGSDAAEELGGVADFQDASGIARSMSQASTMWTSVYDLTARDACILYRSRPETAYHDAIR